MCFHLCCIIRPHPQHNSSTIRVAVAALCTKRLCCAAGSVPRARSPPLLMLPAQEAQPANVGASSQPTSLPRPLRLPCASPHFMSSQHDSEEKRKGPDLQPQEWCMDGMRSAAQQTRLLSIWKCSCNDCVSFFPSQMKWCCITPCSATAGKSARTLRMEIAAAASTTSTACQNPHSPLLPHRLHRSGQHRLRCRCECYRSHTVARICSC